MQMQKWYVKSNELQSFDDLETSLNRHQSKILIQWCCCCGVTVRCAYVLYRVYEYEHKRATL